MKFKVRDITYCAVLAAILAVCSQISFPIGQTYITLQTFAVALCGYMLGYKGLISLFVYLLLGAAGVPVFAGFKGGINVLFSATGGFLVGFIFLTLFAAIGKSGFKGVLLGCIGLLLCHAIGTVVFCFYTGRAFFEGLCAASLPFIFKDVVSVFLAQKLAEKINSNIVNKI